MTFDEHEAKRTADCELIAGFCFLATPVIIILAYIITYLIALL